MPNLSTGSSQGLQKETFQGISRALYIRFVVNSRKRREVVVFLSDLVAQLGTCQYPDYVLILPRVSKRTA
jgi:hypothetical protein